MVVMLVIDRVVVKGAGLTSRAAGVSSASAALVLRCSPTE